MRQLPLMMNMYIQKR